jgi:hypothetical protein
MKRKRRPIYDDQTLENMKNYYKIENHDILLNYVKKYGLAVGHKDDEEPN